MVLSITERMVVADIIRMRAVCGRWAWALGKKSNKHPLPPPLPSDNRWACQPSPWLLLPNSPRQNGGSCTFFSILEGRFYRTPSLPQITNRHLLESPHHGWFVTIDLNFAPSFVNPFTKQELILPSMFTIPRNDPPFIQQEVNNTRALYINVLINAYLEKIIFTPTPQQNGIAVAIWEDGINGITLPFARVGDATWSVGPNLPLSTNHLMDVVYNEKDSMLYALSSSLDVFILKFRNRMLEVVSKVARPMEELQRHRMHKFLVFSHGHLMHVNGYLNHSIEFNPDVEDFNSPVSSEFKIFRFNYDFHNLQEPRIHVCSPGSCWVPVNNLRNQSLILGTNTCFSLNYSGDERKKNKVFFINSVGVHGSIFVLGVFDLERNGVDPSVTCGSVPGNPYPILFMPAPKLWD
ncbi:hypothetical protein KSP39_PZI021839 [Platanthera zijinensis]|uniref:KIB1-4 beta-propeller domain-containing protein n=1 Tax=Platanthera zijinensis TaxID=2320716 RepID=A0AAP0AWW8_9ASPA